MFDITVNQTQQYRIRLEKDQLFVGDSAQAIDLADLGGQHFHAILGSKSYKIEVESLDPQEKVLNIRVNSNSYSVSVKDQYDALLQQLGLDHLQANRVSELKAPMPGLVLKVLVTEGQEVQKGDNLLVLEAMKMENIIKAAGEGTVQSLKVAEGDKVEKNQVLVRFS